MAEMGTRLARLADEVAGGVRGAVDRFWREVTASGTPLVERAPDGSALVTFLWRGEARSVEVAWGVPARLDRLPGTDLWHVGVRLPADVRTVYYLRRNGAPGRPVTPDGLGGAHVDAANPRRLHFPGDPADPTDPGAWVSLLELPGAPPEPWSARRAGVRPGQLLLHPLRSRALGGRRRVWVYRPAGVPTAGLPCLVVFDGFLARSLLRIPTTLDNLIAAGRIPPLVALFVASATGARRWSDLRPGRRALTFVTGELLPWARRRWQLGTDPARCVAAGVSLGGLTAAYLGLRAPSAFGAVISQSGSFWWPAPPAGEPEWLTRAYAAHARLPLRFYLDVGALEGGSGMGPGLSQVEVNRRLRDTLRDRGYPVTYAEYAGGHDYINWRRTFAEALTAVLPA